MGYRGVEAVATPTVSDIRRVGMYGSDAYYVKWLSVYTLTEGREVRCGTGEQERGKERGRE